MAIDVSKRTAENRENGEITTPDNVKERMTIDDSKHPTENEENGENTVPVTERMTIDDSKQTTENLDDSDSTAPDKVTAFRRILPQFLASSAKNLLIVDLGLTMAFPSIVIPALTGLNQSLNPNEMLHMTPVQASWLASVSFIGQPIGSIFSGLLTEPLGRRRAMLLVNIPHIIAWVMLSTAESLEVTYVAFALLGMGVGLMEAPIMTYLSEICEPSVRGVLMSFAGISATSGIFLVFLLGTLLAWRTVALICAAVPLFTLIAVYFVPETPIWLLSKARDDEAMKSLQWLRGWVSPAAVSGEFKDLQRYSAMSSSCLNCEKLATKCVHPPPTLWEKLKDVGRKRTLKPFILIAFQCFIMQFCGIFAMRPYIVQILNAYGVPLDANLTTVILGLLGIVANIGLLATVKSFGKRKIYLWSMVPTFLSCIGLSIYGFAYFPSGWSSFEVGRNAIPIKNFVGNASYIAITLFLIMQFCTSIGVSSVPNMMMSEIFPLKSRAFASGLVAAVNQLLAFAATKTYYDLETALSLPGVILFYGIIGIIGFFAMYFTLPETEQRTLEDIERHFSDNSRSITDIHIKIHSTQNLHDA